MSARQQSKKARFANDRRWVRKFLKSVKSKFRLLAERDRALREGSAS